MSNTYEWAGQAQLPWRIVWSENDGVPDQNIIFLRRCRYCKEDRASRNQQQPPWAVQIRGTTCYRLRQDRVSTAQAGRAEEGVS